MENADVAFLAITDIEYDTISGVLEHQEEIPSDLRGMDLRRAVIGYRGDTLCLVGQAVEKRAIRAYGAARDLFSIVKSCRFFFKVGGAAGRNEIGTISVLSRGPDGVVLHGKTVSQGRKKPRFNL